MNSTRILFVDDHKLFRESVTRLLDREADFTISAQCGSIAEAEHIISKMPIDLILLDYDLSSEIGTILISSLRSVQPGARVLMVTGGMGARAITAAMDAGVSGVVLKHSDPERLIEAIHVVASGGTWWDSGVLALIANLSPPTSVIPARAITDRQRQILALILDGLTNKEIAFELNASESSVKASIQELFLKAGVRTRSQLVRIALENHSSDWLKSG